MKTRPLLHENVRINLWLIQLVQLRLTSTIVKYTMCSDKSDGDIILQGH